MAKRKTPRPPPDDDPNKGGIPALPGIPEASAIVAAIPPTDVIEPADIDGELVLSDERKGRVTPAECATIGHLATQGLSVPQIAELLGRAPETVRNNLKQAKDLLKAFAPEMIALWVDAARMAALKGNHHPMRDFVYAAGAATHAAGGPGGPVMQVAIGIQLPGLPQPKNNNGPEE